MKFAPHPLADGHGFGRDETDGTVGRCECGGWSTSFADSVVGFHGYCDHIASVLRERDRRGVWWRRALRRIFLEETRS